MGSHRGNVTDVSARPCPAVVVWEDALTAYDFGPGHPLAPIRVQLAMRLSSDLGLLSRSNVTVVGVDEPAGDELIAKVHTAEYMNAVKAASHDSLHVNVDHGIGSEDCPAFIGMHEASARVCAATLRAAKAVHSGEALHAVNLAGGLHHAMPDHAAGFCIYNDIGVAIQWLLDQGIERIAYIDVDVHHGDGVQTMFWNDPRVLTISIHEHPRSLWPGTGKPTEIGGPNAQGSAVNIALPAGTGDEGWLQAFHAVVPDLLDAFKPQILFTQQGCDSHAEDPLAHLALSLDGQRMTYTALHRFAHQFADGKWIAVGGGGYEWVDVVPRAWSHLVGEVVDSDLDPAMECPESYVGYVMRALGRPAPAHMTDGRDPYVRPWQHHDPEDPISQAILATREAVFPHWGLLADPYGSF